jgi:outer membrane protein insertion porin family
LDFEGAIILSRRFLSKFILLLILYVIILSHQAECYFSGKKITEIDFSGDLIIKEKEVRAIIALEKGNNYSLEKISRSVRLLHDKGIYENIIVDAVDFEAGVKITFKLVGKNLIKKIKVSGNLPFVKDTILKAATLEKKAPYDAGNIQKYKDKISDFLKSRGYRNSIVTIEKDIDIDEKSVDLKIKIDKGVKTRIYKLDVDGKPYYKNKKISKKSGLFFFPPFSNTGNVLKSATIDNSIKNLEEFYIDEGFYKAEIGMPEITINKNNKLANIKLKIDSGFNVQFDFRGDFLWEFIHKTDTLKDFVQLIKTTGYRKEFSFETIRSKIEDYLIEIGFFDCEVQMKTKVEKEVQFLNLQINLGKRIEIVRIRFEGNNKSHVTDDKLQKLMSQKSTSKLSLPTRYFSTKGVDEDIDNIKSFYQTMGFLETEASWELKTSGDNVNKVDLIIKISEGDRTFIDIISFTGNEHFTDNALLTKLDFKVGKPFDALKTVSSEKAVLSYYLEKGYANAQVTESHIINFDKNSVTINYRISEGNQFKFGKVIIKNIPKTKRSIVMRNLSFKEGDPYSYKLIETSQENLYQTKLFDRVEFEVKDYENKKDIIYRIREKKDAIFDLQFGYNQLEGLDLSSTGYLVNPFSLGSTLGGNIEFSEIKEGYKLSLTKFKYLFKIYSHLYYLRLKKDSYNVKSFAYNLDFSRKLNKWLEGSVGYHYDSAEIFAVQPEAVLEYEDEGHVKVGSLIFNLFVDKRDDPILTTRGAYLSFTSEFASKYLNSKTNPKATVEYYSLPEEQRKLNKSSPLGYFKFFGKAATFLPISKKLIFALSLQAGTAYSYEGVDILPIHKRFFLGGSNTIRGYPLDTVQSDSVKSLKPNAESDTTIGGNAMLCGNVEFRLETLKNWWLVLFSDMGNVWADLGKFGVIRTDWKYTTGAGLRWMTPIGPIRIDYGFKLQREEDESAGEWYISFGHTF